MKHHIILSYLFFVTIFIFFNVSFAFSGSSANIANRTQVKFNYLDEIEEDYSPTLPIKTAEEAIQFALSLEIVRPNLIDAISKGYDNWSAIGQLSGTGDAPFWFVKFTSKRFVPEYTCTVTFNKHGEVIDESANFCGYMK